jgi:ion channel
VALVSMHRHHRRAWQTIGAAVALDCGLGVAFGFADHVGVWNGLYWAEVTGTTTGYGDITPHGWAAHLIACTVMVSVIPLITATFSLMTSGLTSQDVKDHVDQKAAAGPDTPAI